MPEADQAYVREVTTPPDPEEMAKREKSALPTWRLEQIGMAAMTYRNLHHFMLPPPAIVDEEGQPLLSWRVALLRNLGGQELFRLFRLDEPLDSEHNKRLIQFVPSVFCLTEANDTPETTPVLRLSGPRTASPPNRLLQYSEIRNGISRTILAVVASEEYAVPWTKPEDLNVDTDKTYSDKLLWRDGKTLVLTCDGIVSSMDTAVPPEEWIRRALRDQPPAKPAATRPND